MPENNPRLGLILAFLGATCFSFSDMSAKWLSQSFPIVEILFINGITASLTLLCLSPFMRGSLRASFRPHYPRLLLLRTLFVIAVGYLNVYAFSQMPLSNAYALLFTGPIIACILSIPMLKERVQPKEWLFASIGFLGVLIILRPGLIGLSLASLSALGGAVCVAAMNNLARKMGDKDTPFTLSFIPVLASIPFNAVVMVLFVSFTIPSLLQSLLFLFSGGMVALGFFLLAKAYGIARVAIIAPVAYSQIVWSILLDYILYDIKPDIMVLLGVSVIIACGIAIMRLHRLRPVLP